jgi:hypothetical protein
MSKNRIKGIKELLCSFTETQFMLVSNILRSDVTLTEILRKNSMICEYIIVHRFHVILLNFKGKK